MTSEAGTFAPHALNAGLRPREGAATPGRREGHEQEGAGRAPVRRAPADAEAPAVGGQPVAFGPVPTPEPGEPLGPPPTFGTAFDDALGPPPSMEGPAGDVNAPHLALPSIVPLETARRVSERLLAAVKAGDRQVELQLDPPHLGRLRIRLELEGQHVSATLVTQTEAARALLMNQSADLQKSLAEQGLTLTAFDITLEGRQARPDHEGASEGGARAPRHGEAAADRRRRGRRSRRIASSWTQSWDLVA
jgi:flagellar hook-length control protein FliK